jgi:hypothetical protein
VTEAEWRSSTDPVAMLEHVRGRASDRKLRLFAVACCRRIWHLLSDKRSRKAVVISEQYADGLVTEAELRKAGHAAWQAACKSSTGKAVRGEPDLRHWAWEAVRTAQYDNLRLRNCVLGVITAVVEAVNDERRFDPSLVLRELFGNPFRPVGVESVWLAWNDGTVVRIAQAIYDDRAFAELPILGDALEDAGCTDRALLDHCRAGGEHYRGCWVVDLLLNKQ